MAVSRILGPDGQALSTQDLHAPQTAQLAHLQRELATHPTRGLTPSRLAGILDAAEGGDLTAQFDLFEDMEEKDGHIASEMNKRRRACIVEWEVLPPPKSATPAEKKAAAQIDELLQEIPDFEDVLYDVTDAIGKGFACLEIEWHQAQGFWLPKTITHRPQSWFSLHRGYRQEIRLRSGTSEDGIAGERLRPLGWIVHQHKAKSGTLERAALFRQLVWTYLFKNYSVGDLAEFLEIYGIPLRIGKYHNGASEEEKLTLLRALSSIGHNAAGIIPEGMLMEFHAAAQGDPKAFELMMGWCERNQSKVILGATLTSGADGNASTNALGKIHNEVRKDLRDSDIRQLNSTLSRDLVYTIAAVNGLAPGGPRRAPVFQLNTQEKEDLMAYAQALPALVAIGVKPTVKWAHEKLGIPVAQDGEAVLGEPARPLSAAQGRSLSAVEGRPLERASTALSQHESSEWIAPALSQRECPDRAWAALSQHEPSVSDRMAAQLATKQQRDVGVWLGQIRALVDKAASLQDIRDGLQELLPDMSLDDYAQAMAQALACAQLAGRYEVMREAAGHG